MEPPGQSGYNRLMSQPAPRPRPAASISLTFSEFVDRLREMDQLEATLSESMAGQGRMIMLAGEPGIGKTRTAQELASLTETRGRKGSLGLELRRRGCPTILALGPGSPDLR